MIHSTSDNAVGMANSDQLDVALIIGGDNAFNHMIAQPDIRSLSDLRGRTIVVDTANSGYAYLLYAILKKNGSTGVIQRECRGCDAAKARAGRATTSPPRPPSSTSRSRFRPRGLD